MKSDDNAMGEGKALLLVSILRRPSPHHLLKDHFDSIFLASISTTIRFREKKAVQETKVEWGKY